jgi:pantetheine-phosphate adenylyltransferase
MHFIEKTFEGEKKIRVANYHGLTINFCRGIKASYILRGLRTSADFEFERIIAQMNHSMAPEIETVFLMANPALSHISSSVVRDILLHQGDISMFVPSPVHI